MCCQQQAADEDEEFDALWLGHDRAAAALAPAARVHSFSTAASRPTKQEQSRDIPLSPQDTSKRRVRGFALSGRDYEGQHDPDSPRDGDELLLHANTNSSRALPGGSLAQSEGHAVGVGVAADHRTVLSPSSLRDPTGVSAAVVRYCS